jgi:hypothetical protein
MKKYTENIEKIHESNAATIDSMLKAEIAQLYRKEVKSPAFTAGGLKTGEPSSLAVLEKMKSLVEKYTKQDAHGRLELKTQSEIESYS